MGSIPGLGRFPWRTERLHTPVFWPGEFHGLYSLWGHKESNMTEQLSLRTMCLWCEIVMKVIYTLSRRDTCPLKEIIIPSNKMA